jgi:hypothetical protein
MNMRKLIIASLTAIPLISTGALAATWTDWPSERETCTYEPSSGSLGRCISDDNRIRNNEELQAVESRHSSHSGSNHGSNHGGGLGGGGHGGGHGGGGHR